MTDSCAKRYRTLPIIVEAFQAPAAKDTYPEWFVKAIEDNKIRMKWWDEGMPVYLCTPRGEIEISRDDWIVRSPDGEIRLVSKESFELMYEKVDVTVGNLTYSDA